MALVLDYEFDNLSTAADGTRKVVDASGNLNDGIMESGQGLETDGVDDYIDVLVPDFLINGGTVVKHAYAYDTGRDGIWDGANRCYISSDYLGWGTAYNSYIGQIPNEYRIVMSSDNLGSVDFYLNGNLLDTRSGSISAAFTVPYRIGVRSDNATKTHSMNRILYFLDVKITATDVQYDWSNPNAIVEMVITNTNNPNFSFTVQNIKALYTFDEGAGNIIYDLVSGQSYSMVNFPTDNTQWTNADLQPYGHQKLRFKKDTNGNPSALADPKTVRFD